MVNDICLCICQAVGHSIIVLVVLDIEGLWCTWICALPLVGVTVRAIGVGNGAWGSCSGSISGQQFASIMVKRLLALYVASWVVTRVCTVLSVLDVFDVFTNYKY